VLSDQAPLEDDDPVIASYPVYLTNPNTSSSNPSADTYQSTAQELFLLQYPAYRSADTPYNARNLQKPTSLRLKPSTGLLELDIPIDTKLNYNPDKGSSYATSLKRSRVAQEGGTHGLSGGFNTGPAAKNIREDEEDLDTKTIPAHSSLSDDSSLNVQTLGGKIVKPSAGDPIYMLGSFQNSSLHLSHLNALVQVRPQLPHLDAVDELERNRGMSALTWGKGRDGAAINGDIPLQPPAGQSARPESKAIDIKLKPSGSSSHDNNLSTNTNAKLLRAIQQEPWQTYSWIDEDDPESHHHAEKALHLSMPPPPPADDLDISDEKTPNLESAITNSEWLDLMSAPRIEHGKKGDKGLMGKVRGRERERQRRKRNEAARRERATTATAAAAHDMDAVGTGTGVDTGATMEEGNATGEGEGEGTAAEDTADDEGRVNGPSDEDSSEDDQAHQQEEDDGDDGAGPDDVQIVDMPHIPQIDGADEDDDDDEVQEVQRPNTVPATTATAVDDPAPARRRGRPRKSQSAVDPIVVDD